MTQNDGDISLNVYTSEPSSSGKRSDYHGRQARDSSPEYDHEPSTKKARGKKRRLEEGTNEEGSRGNKKKRRPGDAKGSKNSGNSKNSEVISSLFVGNPEIPEINVAKTKPDKQQPVFSESPFSSAGLHPFMVSNLERLLSSEDGTQMTEVQRRAIPELLSGKDALVRSQTGSGKTLAYAVPIIQALQEERPKIQRSQGIMGLIIVPTRELALQTYEWLIKLVKPFTWLVPGVMCGGENRKSEKVRLRRGVTVLVATPGRLLDHLKNTTNCQLSKVRFFVLDEADRMVDMGYERDVSSIVSTLNEQGSSPEQRQTVLLSATLGPGVDRLAGLVLRQPRAFVDASGAVEDGEDTGLSIPSTLQQFVLAVPAKLRLVALAAFIAAKCELTRERKMLVFCATQDMVDYLTPLLAAGLAPRDTCEEDYDDPEAEDEEDEEEGVSANVRFFRLHGSMTQKDRMEVFKTFRDCTSGVLLCTDVAARGLDLPKVDWIVQFNAPPTPQDYVHRVGRTARVGTKGSAVLFLAPSELAYLEQLQERNISLKEMDLEDCLHNLLALLPPPAPKNRQSRRRYIAAPTFESVATTLQMRFEKAVLKDSQLHELACKAYTSFVRFYASYPLECRAIFHYRALHLGHYAKSFALRDPPTAIGGIGRKNWQRDRDHQHQQQEQHQGRRGGGRGRGHSRGGRADRDYMGRRTGPRADRTRELMLSEYASGM